MKKRCEEIYQKIGKEVPKAKRTPKEKSLEQLEIKLQESIQKQKKQKNYYRNI